MTRRLTAIVRRDGPGYMSLCPELDIASAGDTPQAARTNLIEALELFFETASAQEIRERLDEHILVSQIEVTVD